MTVDANVFKLARAFAQTLAETLTPEQLEQVNARNELESNNGICHSHDFCDANQVMIDAAEGMGIDCGDFVLNPSDGEFVERAWQIAKDCGFDENEIGQDELLGE